MKKTTTEQRIEIPPIPLKYADITLEGITALLVNQFSEKCKQQINDKQQGRAKTKQASRDPEAEYEASLYRIGKNKYGIPLGGVKKCAVSACRFIDGVPMTIAKGSFHIIDELGLGLLEVKGSEPVMDTRWVKIGTFGNKKPMERYRGRFDKWSVTFKVRYNANVISAEQLCNLYENAGFSVGLCEHRPEKDGNMGMFQVKRG